MKEFFTLLLGLVIGTILVKVYLTPIVEPELPNMKGVRICKIVGTNDGKLGEIADRAQELMGEVHAITYGDPKEADLIISIKRKNVVDPIADHGWLIVENPNDGFRIELEVNSEQAHEVRRFLHDNLTKAEIKRILDSHKKVRRVPTRTSGLF